MSMREKIWEQKEYIDSLHKSDKILRNNISILKNKIEDLSWWSKFQERVVQFAKKHETIRLTFNSDLITHAIETKNKGLLKQELSDLLGVIALIAESNDINIQECCLDSIYNMNKADEPPSKEFLIRQIGSEKAQEIIKDIQFMNQVGTDGRVDPKQEDRQIFRALLKEYKAGKE